jgi:hypothetical protein
MKWSGFWHKLRDGSLVQIQENEEMRQDMYRLKSVWFMKWDFYNVFAYIS